MILQERNVVIPNILKEKHFFTSLGKYLGNYFNERDRFIRFVITESNDKHLKCEIGILTGDRTDLLNKVNNIFEFRKRKYENTNQFTTVLVVPTGIGAEIGGHAGDANPVAKMLSSVSTTLITHPNVVNASDINELPKNGIYVEGSILSQLMMGAIGLQRTLRNYLTLITQNSEEHEINDDLVNAVSAARTTIGINCSEVIKMAEPFRMQAKTSKSGRAVGKVIGLDSLYNLIEKKRDEIDALGIVSVIDFPHGAEEKYFNSNGGMVNPWGGVEAMLTHSISLIFDIPSAHSPMMKCIEQLNSHFGVVDPRMAAEVVSVCFSHCIFKGLHNSPKIIRDDEHFKFKNIISVEDISCLVIPDGCVGLPTLAALEQGITVIAVRENKNCMKNDLQLLPFKPGQLYIVNNYWEAAGVIAAIKAEIEPSSVRRPVDFTSVIEC